MMQHSSVCLFVCVCLQKGGAIWAEETDGGKVRGEPSRDFAKVGSFYFSRTSRTSQGHTKAFLIIFSPPFGASFGTKQCNRTLTVLILQFPALRIGQRPKAKGVSG